MSQVVQNGRYKAHSWKEVENATDRYFAALMRHIKDYRCGKVIDDDSNLLTVAHMATDALFLVWFELLRAKANEEKSKHLHLDLENVQYTYLKNECGDGLARLMDEERATHDLAIDENRINIEFESRIKAVRNATEWLDDKIKALDKRAEERLAAKKSV
jgi:type VI protein secretion system component Hcp